MGDDIRDLGGDAMAAEEECLSSGLERLVTAGGLDELQERYFDWVAGHVPSFAYGLYLFDRRTGRPRASSVRGLSRFYAHRYEQFGRALDPVLRGAMAARRAWDDSLVRPPDRWREAPIVQGLFRHYDMAHVMCAPLISGGEIVGTINFARNGAEPAFDDGDRRRATVAARMFQAAVAATDLVTAIDAERAAWWGALEASGQAIVVTDLDRAERHANRAARALLDAADGAWPSLDAAIDGGEATRRLAVRPPATDAAKDVPATDITVTSAPLPERPSLIVSILSTESRTPAPAPAVRRLLTEREAAIAELVAAGKRDHEIAGSLHISPNTVKHHLKSIYQKLGVHSRVELAALLLR
ncbi:GAF domain-containing protein [Actinomadura pelletieri DSM 43383]|uniref:GAF domain-containing protein n=1 Tax=Actinomadura pelletieri DSM 43383 TaxID=1120940 RepID=A0A495QKN1_9ACTN|nr:LuxR C-terminal-related transcriptional regulator [Actinomadura pelletieri]RKS73132.1 GAF domain-containing protein [Actinomadura pelletieri DSM 43383]